MDRITDLEARVRRANERVVAAVVQGRPVEAARKAALKARKALDQANARIAQQGAGERQAAEVALGRLAAEQLVNLPDIARIWASHLERTASDTSLQILRAQGWWPQDAL